MPNLYEQDLHAWTAQQARLLRDGYWQGADVAHLIEEIESMGRSERRESLGSHRGRASDWAAGANLSRAMPLFVPEDDRPGVLA